VGRPSDVVGDRQREPRPQSGRLGLLVFFVFAKERSVSGVEPFRLNRERGSRHSRGRYELERKGAETPSPLGFDSAASPLIATTSQGGVRIGLFRRLALGDESGQFGLEPGALGLREDTFSQFGAQFVDMIHCKHDDRLRLDDVDAPRANEDWVRDREATGGAGEWGSRFCRLLRQNWGNHSSLTRAEQPYAQMSSREKNRGPEGAASECRREPAQ